MGFCLPSVWQRILEWQLRSTHLLLRESPLSGRHTGETPRYYTFLNTAIVFYSNSKNIGVIYFDQKYIRNNNIIKYNHLKCMFSTLHFKMAFFTVMQSWIFNTITVFSVTWPYRKYSIMLIWCSKKHFWLLSQLKMVVLLNMFVETVMHFLPDFFVYILNVFTVTCDQFNTYFRNKNINLVTPSTSNWNGRAEKKLLIIQICIYICVYILVVVYCY